jgi:hypothetical protein
LNLQSLQRRQVGLNDGVDDWGFGHDLMTRMRNWLLSKNRRWEVSQRRKGAKKKRMPTKRHSPIE